MEASAKSATSMATGYGSPSTITCSSAQVERQDKRRMNGLFRGQDPDKNSSGRFRKINDKKFLRRKVVGIPSDAEART